MASEQKAPAANMLWGGRFTSGLDPLMVKYNESLPFDRLFYAQDIRGSIAFARANVATGVLTADEFAKIEAGLQAVQAEWADGSFAPQPNDEDIHTANERRLGELIGKDVAGKLHTGRSRNDQVATDMRLWLRDQLDMIAEHLRDLLRAFCARAESDIDVIFPGYTHCQRAQPVRWSHWLLSHAAALQNDLIRLREVRARVNLSPLGCGALAGNPFGIDRQAMAKELGFDGVLSNSMHATADRLFVLETMQWGSMLMLTLSRWSEDLILYSTAEYGFVTIGDAYSTGSSLMPQKKNNDANELLRGKSGRAFGQMAGLAMTVKGLATCYAKDLQESVEPLIDHVRTVSDSLQIATGILCTLTVRPDKMKAALTPDLLATEVADFLVRKGMPFREAHHVSGRCVALAEQTGTPMDRFTAEQWRGVDAMLTEDIIECMDYDRAVELKNAEGGTSRSAVMQQIEALKALLG